MTETTQPVRDDTFSPVKLPEAVSRTPGRISLSDVDRLPHNSPDKIIAVQHGIGNKHGRRNTVHAYPARKLVDTPLLNPKTSPNDKNGNSIRRFNTDEGKENNGPSSKSSALAGVPQIAPLENPMDPEDSQADTSFPDSSPLKKRSHSAKSPPRKIAKTSASPNSVPVNETFFKQDLIAEINSSRRSSKQFTGPSSKPTSRRSSQRYKTNAVIDNDSDSDPEDYGRIENTISQTIIPAAGGVPKIAPRTDFTIVTKSNSSNNYITPQRPTEPVAVSPATNQLGRINEVLLEGKKATDSTSPLKHIRGRDAIDTDPLDDKNSESPQDEPTINMLMSPNSKPVFSVYQLNKMQSSDRSKIHTLRETIRARDTLIASMHDEVDELKKNLRQNEQRVQDLKDTAYEMARNYEILQYQLKHNERELTSSVKSFKNTEARLEQQKRDLDRCMKECAELKAENNMLRQKEEETRSLQKEMAALEEEAAALRDENMKLKDEHSLLKEQKDAFERKCDALAEDSKSVADEVHRLREENSTKQNRIMELQSTNESLSEINSKQEELLKELDNLEGLANDKIYNLERSLSESMNEAAKKNEESEKQINDLANELSDAREEKSQLQHEKTALEEELKANNYQIRKLNLKIESLEVEVDAARGKHDALETQSREQSQKIDELQASLAQKESIISEDIAKLNELVEAIEVKKQSYEQQIETYKEQADKAQHDHATAAKEAAYYREQLKLQEEDAQKKLDEVATFLHKSYAEKHTRKLGDVRNSYEKELSTANQEKKNLQREIDSLKRKLTRTMEEVQKMTDLVQAKGLYTGTSPNGSPMKRSLRF